MPACAELHGYAGLEGCYQQIDQTGLAVQVTVAAWLWKLELVSVKEHAHGRNSAAVGGFEYSVFSIGGTNADLGLIAEYQFNDRAGSRQPVSRNGLAVGFRWAFNDIDSSEILWIAAAWIWITATAFYSLDAIDGLPTTGILRRKCGFFPARKRERWNMIRATTTIRRLRRGVIFDRRISADRNLRSP